MANAAEVAERFGSVEKSIEGFRAGVETELRLIRKLGNWLLGAAFGVVAALVTSAATIGWSASAIVSDVKQQGRRIDRLETRLDAMGKQLDVLIRRTGPKPGASPAVARAFGLNFGRPPSGGVD